ncbi:MAG: pilus assembly protein TadG-related protein [Erythrobacter sp.]
MMRSKSHKGFLKNQQGAVAATYALALIPLIAVAGLGFDYARVAGMDTELQSAADQAALAGATQLDGQSGDMQRAINAIRGANAFFTNRTVLASDGSTNQIDVPVANIKFYSNRNDAEAGTNSFTVGDTAREGEAAFVSITVEDRAADYAFTPVIGALSGTVGASAVAGLGSALCRVPPLMICNPDENTSTGTPPDIDLADRIGQGLLAKPGGGSSWSPGNYGYLDTGPNGAVGVRQSLGWNGPPGNCVSVTGSDALEPVEVDTQTGNIASGPRALNTRFDVYESQSCVAGGVCSPAFNVRKDLMRGANSTPSSGNSCSIHNSGWGEPNNAYHPRTANTPFTGTIDSMGHPRDACHAVQDGDPGNCRNDPFGDGNWDRNAYFRTHYVRSVDSANGVAGTSWSQADWQREMTGALVDEDGVIGADRTIANIARFEVYQWETANAGTTVDGVVILADTPAGASGNTDTTRNQSVCGQATGNGAGSASFERRFLSVAVINCELHDVRGNSTDVPVRRFIDVFLVQPSYARGQGGKHTKQDEIYVEIVRATEIVGNGNVPSLVRNDLPFLLK